MTRAKERRALNHPLWRDETPLAGAQTARCRRAAAENGADGARHPCSGDSCIPPTRIEILRVAERVSALVRPRAVVPSLDTSILYRYASVGTENSSARCRSMLVTRWTSRTAWTCMCARARVCVYVWIHGRGEKKARGPGAAGKRG
jgi:hypothetical protein